MAEPIHRADSRHAALRALPLLDLTNLDESCDEGAIETLCRRARTPAGPVAAVCVYAKFVAQAKSLLTHSMVRVATVANFPAGAADPEGAAAEAKAAIGAGADEVDVVFPYAAFLAGNETVARELVRACRAAARPKLLKVILETGKLGDAAAIRRAATLAIEAGADFVKSSTGKTEPGATLPAAAAMLDAIAAARPRRLWAGLKVSGGIRTLSEATGYMALAEQKLGPEFLSPATFRIGASRLLDDILAALQLPGE